MAAVEFGNKKKLEVFTRAATDSVRQLRNEKPFGKVKRFKIKLSFWLQSIENYLLFVMHW